MEKLDAVFHGNGGPLTRPQVIVADLNHEWGRLPETDQRAHAGRRDLIATLADEAAMIENGPFRVTFELGVSTEIGLPSALLKRQDRLRDAVRAEFNFAMERTSYDRTRRPDVVSHEELEKQLEEEKKVTKAWRERSALYELPTKLQLWAHEHPNEAFLVTIVKVETKGAKPAKAHAPAEDATQRAA